MGTFVYTVKLKLWSIHQLKLPTFSVERDHRQNRLFCSELVTIRNLVSNTDSEKSNDDGSARH